MNNPCPKRILCPTGTGTDSPGTNYTSEHVDVPEFFGTYYPPTSPYGYYTACQGRCMSLISQEDADLCAIRQATICSSQVTNPGKPTFSNTPQICTIQGTGRMVIVPAGVFIASSQEEANSRALSYANNQQVNPDVPPGVHTVPPPTTTTTTPPTGIVPIVIPVPTVPKRPPPLPPPTSHCLPCDDSTAVASFSAVCDVPPSTVARAWESPVLKCGQWRFSVTTDDGGPPGSPQWFVTMALAADDPARTLVDWGSLVDCPQMAFICPCGADPDCTPQNSQSLGFFPGCCSVTSVDCKYAECQTIAGEHYMVRLQIYYSCMDEFSPTKKFTVNGTWLGPVP
jgi:hypothetical protein